MKRTAVFAPAFAVAASLAGCFTPASVRQEREAWKQEWNARASGATSAWENPCATRVFIAWADPFLASCPDANQSNECEARRDWVEERVAQCRAWTAWQLRNFNKHERTEGSAPSVSID